MVLAMLGGGLGVDCRPDRLSEGCSLGEECGIDEEAFSVVASGRGGEALGAL